MKNTVPMEEQLSCMDIIPAGERERKTHKRAMQYQQCDKSEIKY